MEMTIRLFIDGDAFPNLLKPIIVKAIDKRSIDTVVVSNSKVHIGHSNLIQYIITADGPDEADNKIVELVKEGDLVITADIPLADEVITKKAFVIDHSGNFYDEDNVKQALAMRNLMQSIRDTGEMTKGQAPFNKKNVQQFANQLNIFLNRYYKK